MELVRMSGAFCKETGTPKDVHVGWVWAMVLREPTSAAGGEVISVPGNTGSLSLPALWD